MSFSVGSMISANHLKRIAVISPNIFKQTIYYRRTSVNIIMANPIKDSQYLAPGDQFIFVGDLYDDINLQTPIGKLRLIYEIVEIITPGTENTPCINNGIISRFYTISNPTKFFQTGQIYSTSDTTYSTVIKNNVMLQNAIAVPTKSILLGGNGSFVGAIGSSTIKSIIVPQGGTTQIDMNAQIINQI